jgi:hypothetical protein
MWAYAQPVSQQADSNTCLLQALEIHWEVCDVDVNSKNTLKNKIKNLQNDDLLS